MIYAATTIIVVTLCLLIRFILIHKNNGKHLSQSTEKSETEKPKQIAPVPTVNRKGVPSLFIGSGTPPDFFGKHYKPNQRKYRKHKRSNQCI